MDVDVSPRCWGLDRCLLEIPQAEKRLRRVRNGTLQLAISVCTHSGNLMKSFSVDQLPVQGAEEWRRLRFAAERLRRKGRVILEDHSLDLHDLRLVIGLVMLNVLVSDLAREWERLELWAEHSGYPARSSPKLEALAVESERFVEKTLEILLMTKEGVSRDSRKGNEGIQFTNS